MLENVMFFNKKLFLSLMLILISSEAFASIKDELIKNLKPNKKRMLELATRIKDNQ